MYSNCIKCPKLGSICKGPNFTDMSMPDLISWMKARKTYLGWTSQTLAEQSGVPVGTITRVLAAEDGGFKYDTIAPLLQALTGSSRAELPCPDPDGSIEERLTARIAHLEKELADTKAMSNRNAQRDADTIQVLKEQSSFRRKSIVGLAFALSVVALALVTLLIIDYANPDLGFFWRDYSLSITGIYDALRNVFSA